MAVKGNSLTQRRRGAEGTRTVRNCACHREALRNVISDSFSGEWGDECTTGNGVLVLRTVNFTNDGSISYMKTVRRSIKASKIEAKKLCAGDIIVEKSGGTKDNPVGRVVYFDRADEIFLTNNFTQVLRPDNTKVFPRYLLYVLLALYKMKVTESLYNKTTGIQNLQMGKYLELQIPVPSLPEQKRIAAELDKICELKKNAETRLEKLDLLVKSRFVEMFGDAKSSRFDSVKLLEVTSKIGSGATPRGGKSSYPETGISFIRSMNVYDAAFKYDDLAHLSDKQANELRNVEVLSGDVLINITGASIARCSVVPDDVLPARVNQHVAILRPKPNINSVFLNALLISPAYKRKLQNVGEMNGATRQAITKGQLEDLSVILPPLALQRDFAVFVEKVDKLKDVAKKSVEQMDTLYRAKLQEYFG